MIYIALGLVAAIALGQGLTVVAFLFAADAPEHEIDLEDA